MPLDDVRVSPFRPRPRSARRRRWLAAAGAALAACLLVSVIIHGSVVVATVLMAPRGPRGEGGENGRLGGGGPFVEISVAGPAGPRSPAAAPAAPPTPPAAPPAPPAPPSTMARPQMSAHPRPAPRAPRVLAAREPEARADREEAPDLAPPAAPAPSGSPSLSRPLATPAPAAPPPGGGTDSTVTSGGLRPGSVGAQRALLPHARVCGDAVAGVWRAHKYEPSMGNWSIFTLRIMREGNALHGSITGRMWDGGPRDARPLPCAVSDIDITARMQGYGAANGLSIDFGARTYSLQYNCPTLHTVGYNPDHFTGTIDPARQEFQSVNNDGGRSVNEPFVFRRIACLAGDEVEEPTP